MKEERNWAIRGDSKATDMDYDIKKCLKPYALTESPGVSEEGEEQQLKDLALGKVKF